MQVIEQRLVHCRSRASVLKSNQMAYYFDAVWDAGYRTSRHPTDDSCSPVIPSAQTCEMECVRVGVMTRW